MNQRRPNPWLLSLVLLLTLQAVRSEEPASDRAPRESDYYPIETIEGPPGLPLEVGGIARGPDERIYLAIRRGEIWSLSESAPGASAASTFRRFASGLHEPLGLTFRDGWFYLAQRSEVTALRDSDGDGTADTYRCLGQPFGITGNYHEYAYGPVFDRQGQMWISLNATLGKKLVDDSRWRGWSMLRTAGGEWKPVSCGLRSPSGIGENLASDIFITDQQGNWVPTCSLQHLEPGDFHGHVDSLRDASRTGSPVEHPGEIPSGLTIARAAERIPGFKRPAIWFPYRAMGQSATDLLADSTGGAFGPFSGQLLVGDFTRSMILRVSLEKVKGVYQGACFVFRSSFQSAVFRLEWDGRGRLLVGETNRGWNSLGTRAFGLERVRWTGVTPFEILDVKARPDGFRLHFTRPVDPASAGATASYRVESYTHLYRQAYGSPEVERRKLRIRSIRLADDTRSVDLEIEGLRRSFVHELHLDGLRSLEGQPLLHPQAAYTLNEIPDADS